MCTRTPGCVEQPAGSKSFRARNFASESDAPLLARSRRGMVRTLERVESTVDSLLSNTTIASQPHRKPLHSSPLAHLGFENPVEESYVTHPDLLYRLLRREAMPIARVSMPSPHTPIFRFQSEPTPRTHPVESPRKLAADQSKAPATSFLPSTPSASTTCLGATVSVECVPSSHLRTHPRR